MVQLGQMLQIFKPALYFWSFHPKSLSVFNFNIKFTFISIAFSAREYTIFNKIKVKIFFGKLLFLSRNSRELDKIKNTEFLLNGPDVSSIYFDFLSGTFYHSLSKNNFTIRQNLLFLLKIYDAIDTILLFTMSFSIGHLLHLPKNIFTFL